MNQAYLPVITVLLFNMEVLLMNWVGSLLPKLIAGWI
jgi:hypothetical protein